MKNKRFWFIFCCALALAIGVGATWALWPAPQQAPAVKPSSQDDYPELPIPGLIHLRPTSLADQVDLTTLIVDATVSEVKPVENHVYITPYQVQPIYLTVNEKMMGTDDSKQILMYITNIQLGCVPDFQPGDRLIFMLSEYEDGYASPMVNTGFYYVAVDDKVYPARVTEELRPHSGQSLSSFKSEIHSLAQQKLIAMIREGLQGGNEASSAQ